MTLLGLLRHADAGDPETWGGPDALRPLSEKGRRQAERLGRHLAAVRAPIDVFITSPKVRARETADLVAEALDVPVVEDRRLGEPFDVDDLEEILTDAGSPERPVLVGHDPDFSEVLGALIGTRDLAMKKGAFAQVEVSLPPVAGRGALRVLLPPAFVAKP